jgi:hypothetical protein
MATIKYRPYILIGGNTGHGVYRRSPDLKVFVDISDVEELRGYRINENSLELGGNVTLTETIDIFNEIGNTNKNFEYLKEIAKHVELIGSLPVRNSATWAGNLCLKYANLDFPSDIWTILEAINGKIVLCKFYIFTWTFLIIFQFFRFWSIRRPYAISTLRFHQHQHEKKSDWKNYFSSFGFISLRFQILQNHATSTKFLFISQRSFPS